MPIMATRGWDDARATARLLVKTALECIRDTNKGPQSEASLNNVYRLLEAFRVNPFFAYSGRDSREQAPGQNVLRTAIRGRHVEDVAIALDEAVRAVFAGQSKDAAVQSVEAILRRIAYPEQQGVPSQEERARAAQFFETVSQRLSYT
jgi:hypothetical protein